MKVMVIDDEPIVAKGLRSLIGWERLGCSWLEPADNAFTALERIESELPDLLIVDCKMPGMGGIELLQKVRARHQQMKSIFLSGFDEFGLAQQAIRLGASEYMLKPPDIDELEATISRLRGEWEEERSIKRQMEDHLPLHRERFLRSLLEGATLEETAFAEKAGELGLPLSAGDFLAVVVGIEPNPDEPAALTYEDRLDMNAKLRSVAADTLRAYPALAMTWDERQRLAVVVTGAEARSTGLRADLRRLCDMAGRMAKGLVNVGVSQLHRDLHANGKTAYQQASAALEYKYYTGPGEVVFLGDIDWERTSAGKPEKDAPLRFDELRNALKVGIPGELDRWLDTFGRYVKSPEFPIMHTKAIGLQTVMFACQVLGEMHPKFQLGDWLTPARIHAIVSSESLLAMVDCVRNMLVAIMRHSIELRKSGKHSSVEKAKLYIDCHYAANISLEKLAKETCLSPEYLSFLFKQVESITISDYVTHVRIEQAKRLLKSTPLTIYEIAEKVGYSDEKYFSRIFKKKTGFTPSEFKHLAE